MTGQNIEVIGRLPYSPDLAHNEFLIFADQKLLFLKIIQQVVEVVKTHVLLLGCNSLKIGTKHIQKSTDIH